MKYFDSGKFYSRQELRTETEMKKYLFLLALLVFVAAGCGKKEEVNPAVYQLDVFPIMLSDSTEFELNINGYAKGFTQTEENKEFKYDLDYIIEVTGPDGSKAGNSDGNLSGKNSERIPDTKIESQILVMNPGTGEYTVKLEIKDKASGTRASATTKVKFF